jgi:hypothetical protein
VLEQTYLVRYGAMAHVGWFSGSPHEDERFQRGHVVVIDGERGVEVGEVLTVAEATATSVERGQGEQDALAGRDTFDGSLERKRPVVLRLATAEEIAHIRPEAQEQTGHFQLCQRVLQQFNWPWELIDVETLLDDHTLVLHYLGPHELDAAELRAWFRTALDLDVHFEPAGSDGSVETTTSAPGVANGHGCGSSDCGNGRCADGGDAGKASAGAAASASAHRCGTSAHSGCSSCGIMRAMAARNGFKA